MLSEIEQLLKDSNAVLVRRRKHQIWRLPNGKIFVCPSTPSNDYTGGRKSLTNLRHLLGLVSVHQEGERRPKKVRPIRGSEVRFNFERSVNTGLSDQILTSGLAVDAYRQQIADLENQITSLQDDLAAETAEFARYRQKWWFRLFNWRRDAD